MLAASIFNVEETTVKMEAIHSSETLIILCQTATSHRNIDTQRRENLKFRLLIYGNENENHCFNFL
jgi:hypothetical protein